MRKLGIVVLLAGALMMLGTGALFAHGDHPPTDLKKVGDHWTPWDPPPASPEHYIIQKGDTLWHLAEKWFSDPFLWPQIWDENRYILDSHWIYPGDPLVVPGRPTVVPEDEAPPLAGKTPLTEGEGRGAEGEGQARAEARPKPPRPAPPPPPPLMPAADPSDLYCTGYIGYDEKQHELWIAGKDTERIALGEGNVVFINRGRNAGIRAGDEFFIVRPTVDVAHPATKDGLGRFVRRMGKARVLISHEENATALIEMSCEEIYEDDFLEPWAVIPVPMLTTTPRFDALDPTPASGPKGYVVWQRDNVSAFGAGHVIYTDLGRVTGASPGDFVQIYRERGDLPRQNLGQAVILTVGPETSTAKITYSIKESYIGDMVELLN